MITKFDIFKDKLNESLPRQSTVDQLKRIRKEIMGDQKVKIGTETKTMHSDVGDRVISDLKTHTHNNLFWWDNPIDRYICSYEDFVKKDARQSLGYTSDSDTKPQPTDIKENISLDLGWIIKRLKTFKKSKEDENDFYQLVDGISVDLNIKGNEEKVENLSRHLRIIIDKLYSDKNLRDAANEILYMDF